MALITPPQQSRIGGYAATEHEKLDEDQKRLIKTLPSLEAAYKELEDVKKLVEVCIHHHIGYHHHAYHTLLGTRSRGLP